MLLKYADNREINGMINCVGDRPITYRPASFGRSDPSEEHAGSKLLDV